MNRNPTTKQGQINRRKAIQTQREIEKIARERKHKLEEFIKDNFTYLSRFPAPERSGDYVDGHY